jgi:hypothetical protein
MRTAGPAIRGDRIDTAMTVAPIALMQATR